MQNTQPLTECASWRELAGHARQQRDAHLRDLLDSPGRFSACSLRAGDFLLDYSRNRVTAETMRLLFNLASERRVSDWVTAMFAAEAVNSTENRPALHFALRRRAGESLPVRGRDVMPDVISERARMLALADAIRDGTYRGATGARIRRVVNIGIGGSDLGPVMAVEALHDYCSRDLQIRFVSNIDGTQLADVIESGQPEETLFIVCSKSFSTLETQVNAEAARRWLVSRLGADAVRSHFIAVSVNGAAMDRFGIAPQLRFPIWDWVGGRYSMWSSIGLSVAIAIGSAAFLELLNGAEAMDRHFRTAAPEANLPVLLALLGIWNHNHLGATSHAVLPYDGRLHRLPAYLQQLEMESNGKRVDRDGNPLPYNTGTIIWGEPGSNAQHSFFQLLHQGTMQFTADFVAPADARSGVPDQHRQGLANMLAQAEAFARGHPPEAVGREMQASGIAADEIARLVNHKVHTGNHASNIILCRRLTPATLGGLVAMYEHKVFVQAIIWGINPFDQWGVELGKRMAGPMHQQLDGAIPTTLPIIDIIRDWSAARDD